MNLSEPQAGSDLSQVRTKAEAGPVTDDGAKRLELLAVLAQEIDAGAGDGTKRHFA